MNPHMYVKRHPSLRETCQNIIIQGNQAAPQQCSDQPLSDQPKITAILDPLEGITLAASDGNCLQLDTQDGAKRAALSGCIIGHCNFGPSGGDESANLHVPAIYLAM